MASEVASTIALIMGCSGPLRQVSDLPINECVVASRLSLFNSSITDTWLLVPRPLHLSINVLVGSSISEKRSVTEWWLWWGVLLRWVLLLFVLLFFVVFLVLCFV